MGQLKSSFTSFQQKVNHNLESNLSHYTLVGCLVLTSLAFLYAQKSRMEGTKRVSKLSPGKLAQDVSEDDLYPFQSNLIRSLTNQDPISGRRPAVCWAPDTDQQQIDDFYEKNNAAWDNSLAINPAEFQLGARWSATATDGIGLSQGDATTLTWSFVPDGTVILGGCGVTGESTGPSELISFLDAQFGGNPMGGDASDLTQRPWFTYFQQVFDRWAELTGVTYTYEDDDDGAPYASGGSGGVLNVRGDLRIGGHRLDGTSGVLACNYFPNNGDMIIDTDDNFYNAGNILGVRNVLSHEHGHGLGFSHSCPVSQTKLMEPFISTAFDGPQEDDILAGHRQYGDANENNNTTVSALSLGTVSSGSPLSASTVSIDDISESDYYSFTTSAMADVSITVTPTGTTYLAGAQLPNGDCEPGTDFDALRLSNLGVELIGADGTTVVASANANIAGFEEEICNNTLSAGTYYVRVFGDATTVQMYIIEVSVDVLVCATCTPVINEVDYDQVGLDGAEFIELYNPCGASIDLSTYSLRLVTGGSNSTYETINLSGTLASGAYYVICTNAANTMNCDLDVSTDVDFIQDGAPDAIALYDGASAVDVLSYEGSVPGHVEGSGVGLEDDAGLNDSGLSRYPNGQDTDMNNVDFSRRCITPGRENMMDNTDCDVDRRCLTTLFGGGIRSNGNMFDITNSGTNDIDITSFEVNLEAGTHTIEVYYTTTASTYIGNQSTSGAWTLLGSETVVSAGPDNMTAVSISGLTLAAGQSKGLYVTDVGTQAIIYTSGTSDWSDGILSIDLSPGIGLRYPFGQTFSPRQWNGTICYLEVILQPTELSIAATDAEKSEGDAGTSAFTFTVTRSGDTGGSTTVDYAVSGSGTSFADALDFGGSLPSGAVSFSATETTELISINVNGDTDFEADEGFLVTLSNATGGTIITSTANGVIRNDDDDCTVPTCRDTTIYLDPTGNVNIDSSFVLIDGMNDCEIVSVALSEATFTCADEGLNIINIVITDVDDNVSMCSASVTVLDTISPIALCQDITVYLDGTGVATIDSSFINSGSSDNCGVATMVLSKEAFNCADVGVNVVTMTVADDHGNTSNCTATVTVLDTISPIALCRNIAVYLDGSGMVEIDSSFINNGSSDNCEVATMVLSKEAFNCSDVGVNVVTMTAMDVNGNTSNCTATVTVLDTISPMALCQDITVYLGGSGMVEIDSSFINNGSSDNCEIATMMLSKEAFNCADVGVNVVTMTAMDVNGNTSSCTATVTVLDTISPIALCQDITIYLDGSGMVEIDSSFINNDSSDNCGMATMTLSKDTFNCADVGANIVTMMVTDDHGNISNCTATVTVLDTISPMALCQDITVYLGGSGMVEIDSSFINNGSSDNCGVETMVLSKETFNCADVGANEVTMTVADVNGNISNCTATVTVLDTISPIALCQDITVYLNGSGMEVIDSSFINNESTDNCEVSTMVLSKEAFNCTDVGANVVTMTVADVNGNLSNCTATVTVLDTISPIAICQNISVVLDASGRATITAGDIDNGSSDNCGISSMTLDQDSFDTDDIGSTNVNLTITDESNNKATCIATVLVIPFSLSTLPTIVGPRTVCSNLENIPFSVPSLTGVSSYQWSYTGIGMTILDNGNPTISSSLGDDIVSGTLVLDLLSDGGDTLGTVMHDIILGSEAFCELASCLQDTAFVSTAVLNALNAIDIYKVSQLIESDAAIQNDRFIIFKASSSIELSAPFEVQQGGIFIGDIEVCVSNLEGTNKVLGPPR